MQANERERSTSCGVRQPERRPGTTVAHFAAVESSIESMRRRFAEPLDLDGLCREAAMSKFHFVRTFSDVTGTTPHHFLACLRIEKAKELLLGTDADVTEICMTVGYSSLGSFSSTFAELVGLSPSGFRRLPRRGDSEHLFERGEVPGRFLGEPSIYQLPQKESFLWVSSSTECLVAFQSRVRSC